ncbi:MAG: DUF4430 domain-containing protein [Clostridia bacterium]|nr:DUF4430 domain-containing protein [Clostridia bacterium]
MSKTKFTRILSGLLCVVLIAVIAFTVTGCSSDKEAPADTSTVSTTTPDLVAAEILGEGKTTFNFKVVDPEGNEKSFEIRTDKGTVGEALLELGLIEGEDGDYGLYVKTVNGVTVDYDKDGKYWAFYENGQYAAKGVDQTPINPDSTYEFRAEKG